MISGQTPVRLLWIAVAVLALASAALFMGMTSAQREADRQREASAIAQQHIANLQQRLEAERMLAQRQMESLSTTGDLRLLRVARVQSTQQGSASAGYWIWNPATQRGLFVCESLPAAPQDQVYHVWVVDEASGNAIRSGTFEASSDASAHIELQPVQPVTHATELRISLEASSHASRPRGNIVATGKL